MNRNLLHRSKNIICLCLFSSGLLLAQQGLAQGKLRDTTQKATDDSIKRATGIAAGLIPQNIPILFGQQDRSRLVQSVSYLNGKRLESAPVSLLSNSFGGQLAGLYAQQSNGAPRFDNPTLSLRGRNPLVVIDGVPMYNLVSLTASNVTSGITNQSLFDVLSINPEQVESVVLLKDALSTAMLGNQAMDGVLLITTRKGLPEKTSGVTFTAQAGVQTPIGMRKPLSAFDYASLYNEAAINSGGAAVFSPAQLDAYRNGTDPNLYPNVNWQDAVLKKNAPMQRYNLSAGGTFTNMKYFLSLDYLAQGGLLKEDPNTAYGTNVDYKRYVLRSNIDINLDKHLSASFNLLGNIQDYYQPGVGYASVFSSILNTPANATPIYTPVGGTYAGTRQYPTNPYAQAVSTGYLKNNLQAASANISIKRMMDDVVKGLYVKALLSYTPSYEQQIDRSKNYNAYYYPVTADTTQHIKVNTISDQSNVASVIERFQQTYTELSMGYDHAFGNDKLSALLMGRYDNTQGDNTLNQVYKGFSGRVNYSFNNRFNVEAAGAYNGNNRFAPGNQYGFYPSVGASWNIHNEDFFKSINFLSELKVRATYGKVGNANPGYYTYLQAYSGGSAYFFGTGATSSSSFFQGDLVNPNRVAEKANKLDLGFDLAYSQNRGWLNFDYYNNKQYDLLQIRGGNTAVLGQVYPLENIGKNKYYGFEINTGWSDKIGKLLYSVSGNLSTVSSKIIYNDEPAQAYPYMAKTGTPINAIRGYVADGFFTAGNLTGATMSGFTPSAGDVRYKDLNGDGIINQYDQTVIGNNKPLVFYGLGLNLQYNGLDLGILFQGVANRDIMLSGNYEYPFTNNGLGQAFDYNLNRYTPATAATATLPRVTLGTDINNYVPSSLFVRNASYVRLKNFELGFSFSNRLLSAAKIKRVRLFVRGENLLTWSKYKESDPEDYTGLYPIQRVINGGLSVKL
ncbi:SusC/RagA family TonB-linked outer membrane protein [Mucilaginibacter mali]|uniref:SusC/RagA family TonB-linked outer membrane protein n=1 Tax=Mucilaginibacter mali TaxID=2740462 RepID=A0A7D4UNB7_9SPHI|nr:SusC/RagA family TonB-linked outer membrane protein [Mucilaginibacter mali]QKJ28780.1 SusC/RagA family TonB-linked outer membrane protein [Mucilaginibacter mali]